MRFLRAFPLLFVMGLGCSQVFTTTSTGTGGSSTGGGHGGATTTSSTSGGGVGGVAGAGGTGNTGATTTSSSGTGGCAPKTCSALGVECGPADDGCGTAIQCGDCPCPGVCGGAGIPGKCSSPGGCTPKTCDQLGIECGPTGDGCGCLLDCGSCPLGEVCGGGCNAKPGVCGFNGCCPKTCAQLGIQCGIAGDGCGGVLQCGTCPMGQLCGAGHCNACTDACATSADCADTTGACLKDFASGCKTCWSHCSGLMCQGFNTCIHDSECPPQAKCLCGPDGCTQCVLAP